MYIVRVEFALPKGKTISNEESELEISLQGRKCVLSSPGGIAPISESDDLVLVSEGFDTEDEAYAFGLRVKNSLYLCSARLRIGIRAATFARGGVPSRVQKEQDKRLLSRDNGICVFNDSAPNGFASVNCDFVVSTSSDAFIKELEFALDQNVTLTEKETLAFELYISYYYEASERTRFLTLIMVIESLTQRKKRQGNAKEHVEYLIAVTKNSGLEKEGFDSILSSLGQMKKESISQTGRNLVEKYLGDKLYNGISAKEFFTGCYTNRGRLVHSGKIKDGANLPTSTLSTMVSDLLVEIVRTKYFIN
jgi:hypothetical protein